MTVIAMGMIGGHESHGDVAIVKTVDGARVELTKFWVAPGDPDARLYVSPRDDGQYDETAIDLGKLPDGQEEITRDMPSEIDPASIGSVIIHCTLYSVLFGCAVLMPPIEG